MPRSEPSLRQNPSLLVAETEAGLIIHVADQPPLTLRGDVDGFLTVLELSDGTRTASAITDALAGTVDRGQVGDMIRFATSHNVLTLADAASEGDGATNGLGAAPLDDLMAFPGVAGADARSLREKLSASHLVVVGVDGIGGQLAVSAATIGIGRLTLVEVGHDRSPFTAPTSGSAGSVCDDIRRRAPRTRVRSIAPVVASAAGVAGALDAAADLHGSIDLLVLASGHPRSRLPYLVDDACQQSDVPFLLCSSSGLSSASVGPLIVPGSTRSYRECAPPEPGGTQNPRIRAVNDRSRPESLAPYPGLPTTMALVEAVKFLTGYAPCGVRERIIELDTADWRIRTTDLPAVAGRSTTPI